MRLNPLCFPLAILCAGVIILPVVDVHAEAVTPSGNVTVRDNRLIRDGGDWIPHGFVQVAFVAPPGVNDSNPIFPIASENYSPEEYSAMRASGADSVRMQVSQPGLDPENPLFILQFRGRVIAAVQAARAAGLTVIISIQDETQSGETMPTALPDDATRRVWQELAPAFGTDRGVLLELLNEPRLSVSPTNWQAWGEAMNKTIRTVRDSGAMNVVVADGLEFAEQLKGAPRLNDPLGQVAYASHPYAHNASEQNATAWDSKFGDLAREVPVIVTEWTTAVPYYCQTDTTPASVVSFLQYLQDHKIGLEVVTWDWSSLHFGSAVYDFPRGAFSNFIGSSGTLSCMDVGFGPGAMIETWYRTGMPPSSLQ